MAIMEYKPALDRAITALLYFVSEDRQNLKFGRQFYAKVFRQIGHGIKSMGRFLP
jgi:hypothetical protein